MHIWGIKKSIKSWEHLRDGNLKETFILRLDHSHVIKPMSVIHSLSIGEFIKRINDQICQVSSKTSVTASGPIGAPHSVLWIPVIICCVPCLLRCAFASVTTHKDIVRGRELSQATGANLLECSEPQVLRSFIPLRRLWSMTSGCRMVKFQFSYLRSEQTYTRVPCRVRLESPSLELCLKSHFRLASCAFLVGFLRKSLFKNKSNACESSSQGLFLKNSVSDL